MAQGPARGGVGRPGGRARPGRSGSVRRGRLSLPREASASAAARPALPHSPGGWTRGRRICGPGNVTLGTHFMTRRWRTAQKARNIPGVQCTALERPTAAPTASPETCAVDKGSDNCPRAPRGARPLTFPCPAPPPQVRKELERGVRRRDSAAPGGGGGELHPGRVGGGAGEAWHRVRKRSL